MMRTEGQHSLSARVRVSLARPLESTVSLRKRDVKALIFTTFFADWRANPTLAWTLVVVLLKIRNSYRPRSDTRAT